MNERASQDDLRREHERALREASSSEERSAARLRLVAAERRRGQLDLAAIALEEALEEEANREHAGAELAAILAADPTERGARRALACFSAIGARSEPGDPFPNTTRLARAAAGRASFFKATFRGLPAPVIRALGAAIEPIAPGGSAKESSWPSFLERPVDAGEERALSVLYGRLIVANRRRVTARLDDPGPLREFHLERLPVADGSFDMAFAGDHELYLLRRSGGRLLLRHLRIVSYRAIVDETEVLGGDVEVLDPRLVASAGGAFVAGVDPDGFLHVSFSAGQGELLVGSRRAGRGVGLAAATECAAGLALFLDSGGRAVVFGRDGRFSREKRIGSALEVVSAASHGGAELAVLARRTRGCELLRLDSDLHALGEPIAVPYLRAPRDARVVWPTPDLLLVIEPPDVAHAFGADDRRLAWTARIAEPLDDLVPAVADALELVAFGRIENEWGQPDGDLGLARWTRDGLGRHGPTVRVETEPGRTVGQVEVAARGALVALAYREGTELVQRLLLLNTVPASHPAPEEWTFADESPTA